MERRGGRLKLTGGGVKRCRFQRFNVEETLFVVLGHTNRALVIGSELALTRFCRFLGLCKVRETEARGVCGF